MVMNLGKHPHGQPEFIDMAIASHFRPPSRNVVGQTRPTNPTKKTNKNRQNPPQNLAKSLKENRPKKPSLLGKESKASEDFWQKELGDKSPIEAAKLAAKPMKNRLLNRMKLLN